MIEVFGECLETIRDIINNSSNKYKDKIAIREKKNKKIVSYTYEQLRNDVYALGTKLIDMGLNFIPFVSISFIALLYCSLEI